MSETETVNIFLQDAAFQQFLKNINIKEFESKFEAESSIASKHNNYYNCKGCGNSKCKNFDVQKFSEKLEISFSFNGNFLKETNTETAKETDAAAAAEEKRKAKEALLTAFLFEKIPSLKQASFEDIIETKYRYINHQALKELNYGEFLQYKTYLTNFRAVEAMPKIAVIFSEKITEPKPESKPEVEPKPESEAEPKPETKVEPATESKPEVEPKPSSKKFTYVDKVKVVSEQKVKITLHLKASVCIEQESGILSVMRKIRD